MSSVVRGRPTKSDHTALIIKRFQIDFTARHVDDVLCFASFLECAIRHQDCLSAV